MYKFKIIPNEQTPEVTELISFQEDIKMMEKFLSFARRQYNCVGLASNQVSMDGKRINKPFFAIKVDHFWNIVVSPNITKYIGEPKDLEEGCLTWLGKKIIAKRYSQIEVSHYDLKGQAHIRTIDGFEAQIWQHEYNHLIGVEEKIID